MGGNPVFRGTRVPVHMLAELVARACARARVDGREVLVPRLGAHDEAGRILGCNHVRRDGPITSRLLGKRAESSNPHPHRRGPQPRAEARAAHGPTAEIDPGAEGRGPPPTGAGRDACRARA
jgi:hypothetical protein